jgi:hypothetical protein
MSTSVRILHHDRHAAAGKLADAELHFTGGELDGLKLIGFAVWQRRDGRGCDVTFPSREFMVAGRRRRFSLLRAIADPTAQQRVRELVLQAYAEHEQEVARTAAS